MSHTIASAIKELNATSYAMNNHDDDYKTTAKRVAQTAEYLLNNNTPEEIREYLDITRSILNDLEKRMNELEQIVEPAIEEKPPVATKQDEEWDTSHYSEQQQAVIKKNAASRVKRSKKVDAIVENVKGKRDVDAGTKAKIDEMKAQDMKPAKVAQEKRSAKPKAEKASAKKEKRTHEGMSYSEVRKEVSQRKAALNKADQERMVKAGLKNNTWDGAIESLTWLNRYFPVAAK